MITLEDRVKSFVEAHKEEYNNLVRFLEEDFESFRKCYAELHRKFMNEVIRPHALQKANILQKRGIQLTDHQIEHNVKDNLQNALRFLEKHFPLFVKSFRLAHKM